MLGAGAQEQAIPPAVFIRTGIGWGPVFNAPGWDDLVDPLVMLPANSRSMSFELDGPVGRHLSLIFQFSFMDISPDVRAEMMARLRRQFPDDFVKLDLYSLKEDEEKLVKKPIRGFVGCSYRMDYGKWSLQPRVLVGAMTIYPIRAEVVLKRPDSNQLSTLTMIPDTGKKKGTASAFTLGAGAVLQRQIWGRLHAYVSAEFMALRSPVGYTYSLENQVDDLVVERTFGIDKAPLLFPAQFHGGLALQFGTSKFKEVKQ